MFDQAFSRKRTALIVTAVVGGLIILGLVITIIAVSLNRSPYDNGVAIQNFDKLVKNLPKERKDAVFAALYEVVKLNNSGEVPDITDAIIREGSEVQTPAGPRQYSGSFIVDIASLRQSYLVQYAYSPDANDHFMTGYPLVVSCLPADKLIYGEFDCKNPGFIDSTPIDPIVYILPYSTLSYEVRALTSPADPNGKTTLKITLFLSDADYRTGKDAAIESYKQQALSWIRSQGFNPDNYLLQYVVW